MLLLLLPLLLLLLPLLLLLLPLLLLLLLLLRWSLIELTAAFLITASKVDDGDDANATVNSKSSSVSQARTFRRASVLLKRRAGAEVPTNLPPGVMANLEVIAEAAQARQLTAAQDESGSDQEDEEEEVRATCQSVHRSVRLTRSHVPASVSQRTPRAEPRARQCIAAYSSRGIR